MNTNKSIIMVLFFLIKAKYLKYLCLFFLIPMFLYTINILFATSFGPENSFKILSSIGIWYSSPIIISYIFVFDAINTIWGSKNYKTLISNSFLSHSRIIIVILIFASIFSLFSILFSYFMTFSFTGKSITLISFFHLLISVSPLVMFFASIAIILAIFDNQNIGLLFISLLSSSIIQLFGNSNFESVSLRTNNLLLNLKYNSFSFLSPRFEFNFFSLFLVYIISFICLFFVIRYFEILIRYRNER